VVGLEKGGWRAEDTPLVFPQLIAMWNLGLGLSTPVPRRRHP